MSSSAALQIAAARADRTAAILDGVHALKHALRFGAKIRLIACDDSETTRDLIAELAPDLHDAVLDRLTVLDRETLTRAVGRRHPTGVVAVAQRPTPTTHEAYIVDPRRRVDRDSPALLLVEPRHEGNLGAVIRVAAAGGASGVVVQQGPDHPIDVFSRGVIRGAAGLHWALPVVTVESYRDVEGPLIALDAHGTTMGEATFPADSVLCLGSERHGLPAGLLAQAQRVAIPMRPGVSSLNVATAAAVALYAARGRAYG